MRKPSPDRAPKKKRSSRSKLASHPLGDCAFVSALRQLVSDRELAQACNIRTTRRGRPPALDRVDLVRALLFHFMNTTGTFAQHLLALSGMSRSEGTLSERRSALPWAVFARLMEVSLKQRATRKKHPDSFFGKWRVMALDGVQFSLNNSPKNAAVGKVRSSHGGPTGFPKLSAVVLLEVGLHNPVAAAVGKPRQSEWSLAMSVLSQLPKDALLLADALYGCGYFAEEVRRRGRHFLVRVREQFGAKVVQRLKDGSELIEVPLRDRKVPKKIVKTLLLRQIRVQIRRRGFRAKSLRLWTSLLDPKEAPALELARLYGQRWEAELYFRQLKLDLRLGDLLQSQTPETAAQEVAAMIICSGLVAQYRAQAAAGEVPVLRISFSLALEMLRPLWLVLALGKGLIGRAEEKELVDRVMEYLRQTALKPRRTRACLRGLRQRPKRWPKITQPISCTAEVSFRIAADFKR